jgi:hypothetical protein
MRAVSCLSPDLWSWGCTERRGLQHAWLVVLMPRVLLQSSTGTGGRPGLAEVGRAGIRPVPSRVG